MTSAYLDDVRSSSSSIGGLVRPTGVSYAGTALVSLTSEAPAGRCGRQSGGHVHGPGLRREHEISLYREFVLTNNDTNCSQALVSSSFTITVSNSSHAAS